VVTLTEPRRFRREGLGESRSTTERKAAVTTAVAPSPLTASDRCDRCGAQAYLRVDLAGGELLFCAHHAREHGDKLRKIAVNVHDETSKLLDPPTTDTR
jgi:hypothetical protein